ncbi:hypothetical protein HMPREF3191_00092 [Veillonellaceae bacterium DNF00626]|nr:hypothetical protein HMPREF3191_00092 [Veillonellaceae bacterium DNF00626]
MKAYFFSYLKFTQDTSIEKPSCVNIQWKIDFVKEIEIYRYVKRHIKKKYPLKK